MQSTPSRVVVFRSMQELEAVLEEEAGKEPDMGVRVECVDVPCHIINRLNATQSRHRVKAFNKHQRTITLEMLSPPHEVGVEVAEGMVRRALERAGMLRHMTSFRGAQAPYDPDTKVGWAPDVSFVLQSAYFPEKKKKDAPVDEYPHIVVEVGRSEPGKEDLHRSAQRWLTIDETAPVRMVMTLSIIAKMVEIFVYSVGSAFGRYDERGRIVAVVGPDGYKLDEALTDRCITVPFINLFYRQPKPAEGEGPFEILADDFLSLSREQLQRRGLMDVNRPEGIARRIGVYSAKEDLRKERLVDADLEIGTETGAKPPRKRKRRRTH
ncbi:hypothetical protein KEM56_006312 [Ascosphaera pollenicola]|nr:hypothetical protein KEM56_006312 [Ascosphaera pollenicola]